MGAWPAAAVKERRLARSDDDMTEAQVPRVIPAYVAGGVVPLPPDWDRR
jgi:hypothetical protein